MEEILKKSCPQAPGSSNTSMDSTTAVLQLIQSWLGPKERLEPSHYDGYQSSQAKDLKNQWKLSMLCLLVSNHCTVDPILDSEAQGYAGL